MGHQQEYKFWIDVGDVNQGLTAVSVLVISSVFRILRENNELPKYLIIKMFMTSYFIIARNWK